MCRCTEQLVIESVRVNFLSSLQQNLVYVEIRSRKREGTKVICFRHPAPIGSGLTRALDICQDTCPSIKYPSISNQSLVAIQRKRLFILTTFQTNRLKLFDMRAKLNKQIGKIGCCRYILYLSSGFSYLYGCLCFFAHLFRLESRAWIQKFQFVYHWRSERGSLHCGICPVLYASCTTMYSVQYIQWYCAVPTEYCTGHTVLYWVHCVLYSTGREEETKLGGCKFCMRAFVALLDKSV